MLGGRTIIRFSNTIGIPMIQFKIKESSGTVLLGWLFFPPLNITFLKPQES